MGNRISPPAIIYTQAPSPMRQPAVFQLVSDEDVPRTGYPVPIMSSFAPAYEQVPQHLLQTPTSIPYI